MSIVTGIIALLVLTLIGAIVGALYSLPQWLVLRPRAQWARWWVPYSALGGSVGWLPFILLLTGIIEENSIFAQTIAGMTFGASIGAGQWIILRRIFQGAYWWIAASAAGLGVQSLVISSDTLHKLSHSIVISHTWWVPFASLLILLLGASYYVITGACILWLKRYPMPAEDDARRW